MNTSEAKGRLHAEMEFVRAMAEVSPAMLWMGDQQGKCVFLNTALRQFWGVDPVSFGDFDWNSTVHPDDIEALAAPFIKAMAAETPFTVEARYRRADGEYRTMRTIANPRFGENGEFLGMTGVNIDITEQLAAEEHTRLLMAELNHRTKNILSVVQAIARKTVKDATPAEFIKSFSERLQSLSACNDLLLRTDWSGVQFDELVRVQLAHLKDFAGERLFAEGPPIRVSSQIAQTLGMALHEISTNCLKHGAFANDSGTVTLTWGWLPDGGWQVEWKENAPLGISAPLEKGFGHTVIIDMVAATLNAEVFMDFPKTGFIWRVTCATRPPSS